MLLWSGDHGLSGAAGALAYGVMEEKDLAYCFLSWFWWFLILLWEVLQVTKYFWGILSGPQFTYQEFSLVSASNYFSWKNQGPT